jgi:hypothetical protein
MHRPFRIALLLLALPTAACAVDDEAPIDLEPPGASGKADDRIEEGVVSVAAASDYSVLSDCAGVCACRYSFWIDLDVRDDSSDKQVGIVWTTDDWETYRTTWGRFDAAVEGGYERWSVDESNGTYNNSSDPALRPNRPPTVEYAAFVVMNGKTYWDPRNSHLVARSPFHP